MTLRRRLLTLPDRKTTVAWLPIFISGLALIVSYLSYRQAVQPSRPFLTVDYVTVAGGGRVISAQLPSDDVARLEYLDREYYAPLRSVFGRRMKIANSPTTTGTALYDEFSELRFMLISNVTDYYCSAIELDVLVRRNPSFQSIQTADSSIAQPSVEERIATLRFSGLPANEVLAVPIQFTGHPGYVESHISRIAGSVTEIEISSIRYRSPESAEAYVILPRPPLESSVIIGTELIQLDARLK